MARMERPAARGHSEIRGSFQTGGSGAESGLEFCGYQNAVDENPPKTFAQVMRSINKGLCLQALISGMRSLLDKGTFGLASPLDLPAGQKALATKWVFDIKRDINGTITKFKTRWVARGDLQKKGADYRETFTPVISFPSLRIILTIAAKHNLEIGQLDVISAFLNGLIDTVPWSFSVLCSSPYTLMLQPR